MFPIGCQSTNSKIGSKQSVQEGNTTDKETNVLSRSESSGKMLYVFCMKNTFENVLKEGKELADVFRQLYSEQIESEEVFHSTEEYQSSEYERSLIIPETVSSSACNYVRRKVGPLIKNILEGYKEVFDLCNCFSITWSKMKFEIIWVKEHCNSIKRVFKSYESCRHKDLRNLCKHELCEQR